MGEMLSAGESVYAELKNLIVWAKDNGGMRTLTIPRRLGIPAA
jgi:hypothetical protein